MEPAFEMLWDCAVCGTPALLGKSHRQCPNCGAPQDPARRYFPPAGQETVTANHTFDGVDKICAACNTPNGARSRCCRNCGAPLEGVREAVRREDAAVGDGTTPLSSQRTPVVPSTPSKRRSGCISGCLVASVLLLLAIFMFEKDVPRVPKPVATDAVGLVLGHRWERRVTFAAMTAAERGRWCDQTLPSNAYKVRRSRDLRTRKVRDGEDCKTRNVDQGDGTFRQVTRCTPRYREEKYRDDYCSYTVNEWGAPQELVTSGTDLSPTWPALSAKVGECLGCVRETARDDRYKVLIKAGDRQFECSVPEAAWAAFVVGTQRNVKLKSGVLDCASVAPP